MSMWSAEIAKLRREVVQRLEQLPSLLFGWTLTAKSTSLGDGDQMQTGDGSKSQRPARRIEPWGHRGRPPAKVRSFWIRIGGSNVLHIGIGPGKGYGPQDLDDGESAVYNVTKALVRLWKSGKLTIDSDGDDVVVNDGTKKVARVDDTLTASANITTWAKAVETALNTAGSAILPASSWDTLMNGAAGALGKIATGADHFKG